MIAAKNEAAFRRLLKGALCKRDRRLCAVRAPSSAAAPSLMDMPSADTVEVERTPEGPFELRVRRIAFQ